MYKTVRHGENSLQYTILPQTEEVLSNSGLKGKGRDYSPSIHMRRANRKFALKFVLFIVVGLLVSIGFASIPVYSVLYARRIQQNQHEAMTLLASRQDVLISRKNELNNFPEESSTEKKSLESSVASLTSTTTTFKSNPTTGNSEKGTTPPWNMPALRSWKFSSSSTTVQPIPTEDTAEIPLARKPSESVRLLDHYMSMSVKPWEKDTIIRATVTPQPVTVRNVFRHYSRAFNPSEKPVTSIPKLFEDVLITTKSTTTQTPMTTEIAQTSENSKLQDLKDTILSVDDDDEFKESLEVDEVFSLPPLKPDTAAPATDADEVTVSKATEGSWYGGRLPFLNTSQYFQWTGYTTEDNFLPLLAAAMVCTVVGFLLYLVLKTFARRCRSTSASAQIGLTSDLQADDKTNLLTAENPEETEE
ncbi:uncharacterized protein LOC120631698 [Pararge aegeria]|uniref:Jg16798 protein n=1 Tax=Pararge aegeria aegeria TaxID=348720 RepID=A0A8S4S2R6_9NEOP|nr:uncharacterized protein LOC120631698 [Pararge aegeria]CAH2243958.1 jg16798 [Pararge aegeria aegeria]